jgi:hypothetical protein
MASGRSCWAAPSACLPLDKQRKATCRYSGCRAGSAFSKPSSRGPLGVIWAARLAVTLVGLAGRIMPSNRGDWARAMSAEVPHIQGSKAVLLFALGCVTSALIQRASSIAETPAYATGLAAGAFYAVHAAIPNSERWPWIWPIAAGIVVAVGPKAYRSPAGLTTALRAGARAGAACGVVFFAFAVAFVSLRSWLMDPAPSLESRLTLLLQGGFGAVFVAAACAGATRLLQNLRHRL